jgi:alpha-mannosidase
MPFQFKLSHQKHTAVYSLVVASFLVASGAPSPAQRLGVTYDSAAQTAAALKALSPASQQILDRIKQIGLWPLGDFRYATGIIPNGESVSLNDSSWKTLQSLSGAPTDELWLRKWIEVPKTLDGYDPTGASIWMPQLNRGAMTIYLNGERVMAGEDMAPITLFSSAKPGDKVLLAIHMDPSRGQRRFRPIQLHLKFAPNRPDPQVLYTELVAAAVLAPSLSADNLPILDHAIQDIDTKALEAGQQEAFDASINKAKADLEPVSKPLGQVSFHETGNSHIDAAWTWPWTETVDVVRRTFDTAANLMRTYPFYTYTQSAAQYNMWLADKYPPQNARIADLIKQGKWEIVGGMWVEPDLNMPDGESLTRQLLIGKRAYKQLYGIDVRIGWNPDSFGYNWQLPQIYKKSGVDYFVTQKMSWNETNQLPVKLFWWESPDGSKVLAYFPDGYGNNDFSPIRLSNDLAHARTLAPGLDNMMDLYGVGDHGGGATGALLQEGAQWTKPDRIIPKMQFGTAQSFFSDVESRINPESPVWNYETAAKGDTKLPVPTGNQISIPTWKDELYLEFHRGVFTTQSNHKRNMREAEEEMLDAEKFASLAWLDGKAYPADELNDAWKKVLFNQFHDLAAGSGIAVIYRDAQKDYDQVRWATDEISSHSLKTVASHIDTKAATAPGSVPLVVFNPLAWERGGVVETDVQLPGPASDISVLDANGRVLPSQVLSRNRTTNSFHMLLEVPDAPSVGYRVLRVVPGKRPFASDLKVNGMTLENSALRVVIDPTTGCVTSLYDKKSQFESFTKGSCGNELQTFTDKPKMFDAWNIDANFDQTVTRLDKADSVKLVESGPLRAVVRVTRSWQSSKFVQDIELYDGMDEVNVVNDIDWHETHVLLKAAFDLTASAPVATYEIPYGTINRPTTRNNSWEDAKFEVPAIRWADLGDGQHGFSLINETKYGYDTKGKVMRISLLRSSTEPDPHADQGHHHFRYALFPHAGDWKQALTMRRGYEYNYKLQAVQVEAHSGELPAVHSFVGVDSQNVVLTAIKKAEDSNALIFRFYEWAGKDGEVVLHIPPGAISAKLTNLMEQPEGSPLPIVGGNTIHVHAHPFEIMTVAADYAPAAENLNLSLVH